MPPKVFFILGGPGAGKGTMCARLVQDYGYTHYCAGDLLREAAAAEDSDVAKKIAQIIRQGNIVPSEITVELLHTRIAEHPNPRGYLVDGFPRKLDQAQMFEDGIAKAAGIIFFNCTQDTMQERLLARAASGSARSDDNIETMRRRFQVNAEMCQPVVDKYTQEKRCFEVDANKGPEEVYAQVKQILSNLGEAPLAAPSL